MYSDIVYRLIDLINNDKKMSGRLISQITPIEKNNLIEQFGITDISTIIYCLAKNINVPTCLNCDNKVTLKNQKQGFRKFCSTECSCKHNNKIHNKKKNKTRSIKLNNDFNFLLEEAAKYYTDNIKTIAEVSEKYQIPKNRLRKYLLENNLIKFDLKSKRHQQQWFQQHNFLVDGTLKELIDSGETTKTISEKYNISPNCVAVYAKKFNYEFNSNSSYELKIQNFLDEINIVYIKNTRKIISPYELDFYIPEKNIAIEINGEYWHSSKYKNKNYHLDKQILCENNNIKLLQFFTNEFDNFECVKDVILSALGLLKHKIYARKTNILKIENKIAKEFLDKNHLFGYSNCSFSVGLFFDQELVSVATFRKPRFNKAYDLELIRFANKINTGVVGGLSKLLKFVGSDKSIISYAHRRLFSGNSYINCGFKLKEQTKPGYFWYSKKNGIVTRYKTQKHKLNTTLTENEYMENLGFMKVYDCGQNVYTIG